MSFTGSIIALVSFNKKYFKVLKYLILLMTLTVIITDLLGIYIYGIYRNPSADSARSKILASDTPYVHEIFMEFKEFSGIYVAILMILTSFVVFEYKTKVLEDKKIRNLVLFLLIFSMLLTLITFGLGAYITKVQSI